MFLDTEKKIRELSQETGIELDFVDVGITLSVAMSTKEQNDLEGMIDWMLAQNDDPTYILGQVMHDLNGCKARHLGMPEGDCFSPKSIGYANKN